MSACSDRRFRARRGLVIGNVRHDRATFISMIVVLFTLSIFPSTREKILQGARCRSLEKLRCMIAAHVWDFFLVGGKESQVSVPDLERENDYHGYI